MFIAKAIIDRLLVVAPNVAPPVPKCALYTAMMAASSVRVRISITTLPTIEQALDEQQDFISQRGKRSFSIVLDPRAGAQHTRVT